MPTKRKKKRSINPVRLLIVILAALAVLGALIFVIAKLTGPK